jgi:alpha,alpha-trehalose phosphorylase
VTGPDEYNALVDNNCYTNMMARANLHYAFEVFNWMRQKHLETWDELSRKLNLTGAEAGEWKKAGDSIYIPGNGDGLYLQDEGFLNRVPWDFENTPKGKYPLLLHYHPLVIYRHQVCKQADLILALFMLWNEFSLEEKRINFDFYEKLTTHDSSLSTSIFCILASELGYHEKALDYFNRSIRLDLDDNHGNTKDGIHAANMAGTCLCVLNGFAGIRIGPDGIRFNPVLPPIWEGYAFKIQYKNRLIQVEIGKEGYQMTLLEGQDLQVMINGVEEILHVQQTLK